MSGYGDVVSICHFAPIMWEEQEQRTKPGASDLSYCTYCGNGCQPVGAHAEVSLHLELAIRKWGDGDITFEALKEELLHAQVEVWQVFKKRMSQYMQRDGKPVYVLRPDPQNDPLQLHPYVKREETK